MIAEYSPTTEVVRRAYISYVTGGDAVSAEEAHEEFETWLRGVEDDAVWNATVDMEE